MSAAASVEERFAAAFGACLAEAGVRRVGLAVSGGSDSMALMNLAAAECKRLGLFAAVLCFDHAIEGENSAAEGAFVAEHAKRLGLPLLSGRADPPVAAGGGLSLEMAARRARLGFFKEAAGGLRLDAVATGHQRDDVAESLLMRLLRGAGATGLSALRPVSRPAAGFPAMVRPLLGFGRAELRSWLAGRGVPWMDDVSNSNQEIRRCRVRLSLIPEIARAMGLPREDVTRSLAQSAEILRDDDAYLDALAASGGAGDGGQLDLAAISGEAPSIARRRVRQWLMGNGLAEAAGFSTVGKVLAAAPGASVNLPGGAVADIDKKGVLRLRADAAQTAAPTPEQMALPAPGTVKWGAYSISARPTSEVVRRRGAPGKWPAVCTLSADAVAAHGSLNVRTRREGDRMRPFGVGGTRSLQDIFVDCGIPAAMRRSWPVVCAGGEVAWIPGYRIAAPFAVKDGEPALEIAISREVARDEGAKMFAR